VGSSGVTKGTVKGRELVEGHVTPLIVPIVVCSNISSVTRARNNIYILQKARRNLLIGIAVGLTILTIIYVRLSESELATSSSTLLLTDNTNS